jgi:hypothetical protein
VDARLGWHFARNLELSVAGQNLLQPRHGELGSILTERSAYAQITWKNIENYVRPESLTEQALCDWSHELAGANFCRGSWRLPWPAC